MELKVFSSRRFIQLIGTTLLIFTVYTTHVSPNQFLKSKHTSVIVVSSEGNDTADCWKDQSLPCASLGFALNKPNLNDTLVLMKRGIHNLSEDILLENVHNFGLHGEVSDFSNSSSVMDVGIRCIQRSIGLSFKLCSNLGFSDFEIKNCSGERISSSKSKDPKKSNISMVWTAMYFQRCLHMTVRRVKSSDNLGMGAVMYDVGGMVYFENATFQRNIERKYYLGFASGGGLYIDFTFQMDNNSSLAVFVSNSKWIFKNCSFIKNIAEHDYSEISTDGQDHVSFGRGGGISIMVRGNATNNKFIIEDCSFLDNIALWGAGLFLEYHDNAKNNTLIVKNSYFRNNSATYAGGGVRIGTTIQKPSTGNTVTIASSHIIRNKAKVGGGFCQYRSSDTGKKTEISRIKNCTFDRNIGVLGSAVYLVLVHMECTDSNFIGNTWCSSEGGCRDMIGQGSIYCSQSELTFRENNGLKNNENSAIVLDTSHVIIHDYLTFVNNSGFNGGAVAMYGHSLLRLTSHSRVDFINNSASDKGGAIYFDGAGPPIIPFNSTDFILNNHSCLIILGDHDTDNKEPDNFPVKVNFVSNDASFSAGNAIFARSVAGCRRWGDPRYSNTVLREKMFNYSLNKEPAIATSPIEIETDPDSWKAFPGERFKPTVILRDEYQHSVYGTIRITVKPLKGPVNLSGSNLFVVKEKITGIALKGTEGARFSLLLETVTTVPVRYWIHSLTLNSCPLGFFAKNGRCECLSSHKGLTNGVTHCFGRSVYILKGRWANPTETYSSEHGKEFAKHICPERYCTSDCAGSHGTPGFVDCLFQRKNQCAKHRKWNSVLCGECEDGYSVKFGSEQCGICTDSSLFIIIPVIVSLSLFVLLVLLLNINTYSTYLNAYLYSYQIIPLIYGFQLPGQNEDPFISVVVFLSGLAGTGDAKVGVCLWNGFTNIQKIAVNYFTPTYMIVFTAAVAKLSAYLDGKELGSKMQKLRTWLFDKHASLHAFAFIAVVAYSNFTRITLMLLRPAKVRSDWVLYYAGNVGFFSKEHLKYAIPALLVAVFIVLPFPIIVMFPYLITGYFSKLKGVFDALQYCFRNELSFFAGFYFVCRLCLLISFVYIDSNALKNVILLVLSIIFVVLFTAFKPYKDDSMNIFDLVMLTNVSIIAGLNAVTQGVVENDIRDKLLVWTHILVYVPLIGLLGHLGHWLYQKKRKNQYRPSKLMIRLIT